MLILCQDIPKCYSSLYFLEFSAYILLVTAWLCLRLSNGWVHAQPYDGKRASPEEQQLRAACCHQNEPSMLQLILQEPLGKENLGHRWTRLLRVQQPPLKHHLVSVALGNRWHQTGELLCALMCVISGPCETVGFLPPSCRAYSRTSAPASLRNFFTIHAEIFPCWVLPLWTS